MTLHPGVVFGVFVLVVLTTGLVLLAVMAVWRNGYARGWRASGRPEPRCPECGYNLTGLRRCRCSECGRESTLDEIVRSVWAPSPSSGALPANER